MSLTDANDWDIYLPFFLLPVEKIFASYLRVSLNSIKQWWTRTSLVYCFFNHMWNSTYDFASFVHWIERNSQMGIGKLFRLILFMYLVWYWLIYDRESTVSDRKKWSSAMARDVAYHVSSRKLETSLLSLQHHIYHHIHYCNLVDTRALCRIDWVCLEGWPEVLST